MPHKSLDALCFRGLKEVRLCNLDMQDLLKQKRAVEAAEIAEEKQADMAELQAAWDSAFLNERSAHPELVNASR